MLRIASMISVIVIDAKRGKLERHGHVLRFVMLRQSRQPPLLILFIVAHFLFLLTFFLVTELLTPSRPVLYQWRPLPL